MPSPGEKDRDTDWTYGGSERATPKDMFAHCDKGTMKQTRYFGDMHTSHLREDGLHEWAESLCEKLAVRVPDLRRALRDGADVCKAIDTSNGAAPEAQEYWLTWLYLMHSTAHMSAEWDDGFNIPIIPTKADVESAHSATSRNFNGGVDIFTNGRIIKKTAAEPVEVSTIQRDRFTVEIFHNMSEVGTEMFDMNGKARFVPVGYANWAGLKMLADTKYAKTFPELQEKAARFVNAFEELYAELSTRFPDSALLDKSRQPPWFSSKDGRQTLFSNVFHVGQAPMSFKLRDDPAYPSPLRFATVDYPWRMQYELEDTTKGPTGSGAGPLHGAGNLLGKCQSMVQRLLEGSDVQTLHKMLESGDAIPDEAARKNIMAAYDAVFVASTDKMMLRPGWERKVKALLVAVLQSVEKPSPQEAAIVEESAELVATLARNNAELVRHSPVLHALIAALLHYKYANWGKRDDDLKHEAIANLHVLLSLQCLGATSSMYQFAVGVAAIMRAQRTLLDKEAKGPLKEEDAESAFKASVAAAVGKSGSLSLDAVSDPTDLSGEDASVEPAGVHITAIDINRRAHPVVTIGSSNYVVSCLTVNASELERYKPAKVGDKSAWTAVEATYSPGSGAAPAAVDRLSAEQMVVASFGAAEYKETLEGGAHEDAEPAGPGVSIYGARFAGSRRGPFDGEGAGSRRKRIRGARTGPSSTEEDDLESKGFMYVSDTMKQRWRLAARETDLMLRLAKLAFLASPVNGTTLQTLVRSNDVFPFGFLLFRPYMTYLMGSGILTVRAAAPALRAFATPPLNPKCVLVCSRKPC